MNPSNKVFKGIGILFILFFIILIVSSFTLRNYDSYGNHIDQDTIESTYSRIDGIGVPLFLKENNFLYTSQNVSIIMFFLITLGTLLLSIPNRINKNLYFNLSLRNLLVFFVILFITFIIYFFIMFLFKLKVFLNFPFYFFNSFLFIFVFIYKGIFKLIPIDKILFSFISIICFFLGIGIIFETINYLGPAYIHEGNWALIDGNGISLYNKPLQYNFNFGYIVFRLSNIVIWLFAFIFLLSLEIKKQRLREEV